MDEEGITVSSAKHLVVRAKDGDVTINGRTVDIQ
jgi:hypothetical protein